MTKSSAAGRGNAIGSEDALRLAEQAAAMPANDPRRTAASIAMFDRLSLHWSLRGDERETLLGGIPKSTWSEWKQRPTFARIKSDTRERIANLFTIDLNAHALFAPEFADRWVREPNAAFAGESPLSAMLRGKVEDVISVRRYLERIRTSSPSETTRASETAQSLAVSYLPGRGFPVYIEPEIYRKLQRSGRVHELSAMIEDALANRSEEAPSEPKAKKRPSDPRPA